MRGDHTQTLLLKDWQVGYLAAMIDAECHVGIQRMMDARRRTPCYTIRFELAMTDVKPVDFINSLLPTAKRIYVGAKGRRCAYHRLRLTQQEALRVLRTALPYVQGKRRQIELCIAIDALRRKYSPSRVHAGKAHFARLPDQFAAEADVLFSEFRSLQLNKKPRKR